MKKKLGRNVVEIFNYLLEETSIATFMYGEARGFCNSPRQREETPILE
jgi:hypothetical protein